MHPATHNAQLAPPCAEPPSVPVAGLFEVRGDMGSPDGPAGLKITLGALELGGGAERLEVLPLGTDDPEEELVCPLVCLSGSDMLFRSELLW